MRYQGRITNWKDEQGFGFITPNGGGKQVFIHIKSFSNRQRRPVGNDLVTYELKIDSKGRPQSENVAFVGDRAPKNLTAGPGIGWLMFAVVFLTVVAGAVFVGKLPFAVLGFYLACSVVTFIAYAWDKSSARMSSWRTAESKLHIFGLVGGWPGALVAQRALRHKSKKQSFQHTFWVTVVLNCIALGWLLSTPGSRVLQGIFGAT